MKKELCMKRYLISSWQFCRFIVKSFTRDNCPYHAASLTFTTLLAIVPLMVVGLSVFIAFPVFQSWGDKVQNFIFANFVPATGKVIQAHLIDFARQANQLSVIGVAILFITAILVLFTIEESLNMIWRVHKRRQSLGGFLFYWAILTLSPLLLGLGLAISGYLFSLPMIKDVAEHLGLLHILLSMTPFLLTTMAFILLYVVIPNRFVPFRYGLIGGIFAGVLFNLAKKSFAFYVIHFTTYKMLYGTLAIIPLFLIWIYVSWLIILLGAELTHALMLRPSFRTGEPIDGFSHGIRWVYYLWLAQKSGVKYNIHQLICHDNCPYHVEPEVQIETLEALGYITRVNNERYILSIDINSLTLDKLNRDLPWKLPSGHMMKKDLPWEDTLSEQLLEIEKCSKMVMELDLARLFTKESRNDIIDADSTSTNL